MKKIIVTIIGITFMMIGVISTLIMCGCGHNLATQSKGWGIDMTWNPDALMPSVKLGYWDISYAMVRENTEVDMISNAGLKADSGKGGESTEAKSSSLSASASGTVGNTVKLKTGPQSNGYVVDILTSDKAKDNDKIAQYIYGAKTTEAKTEAKEESKTAETK